MTSGVTLGLPESRTKEMLNQVSELAIKHGTEKEKESTFVGPAVLLVLLRFCVCVYNTPQAINSLA